MQMERKTMEQDDTCQGEMERTAVSYQVTAPDSVNYEPFGEVYYGREPLMGKRVINNVNREKYGHSGTYYVTSHVAEIGRILGSDQGGSRNTEKQQSADRHYMCGSELMPSHGVDPGNTTGNMDCEEEWGGYGHQDTRILLPSNKSYDQYQRTNVKLNPIFE